MNELKRKSMYLDIKETTPKTKARPRPCCVPGCNDAETTRYFIPADSRVKDIWLNRIQNPKLFARAAETGRLKNFAVCANHFDSICIQEGKLMRYALPTLNLPGHQNTESTVKNCFSYPPNTYELLNPTVKLLPHLLATPAEDNIKPVLRPQRQYPAKRRKLLAETIKKEEGFIKLEDSSDSQSQEFASVEVCCKLENMEKWEENSIYSDCEVKTEDSEDPLSLTSISPFPVDNQNSKKSSIVKMNVHLLNESNAEYLPWAGEIFSLNECGLGRRSNIHFDRTWSYEDVYDFVCSLYEDVPLEEIGFKFAKCATNRKLTRLEHVRNMEDIINEVTQSCLVCIPNEDIPKMRRRQEEGADDQVSTTAKVFSSDNPTVQEVNVVIEEVLVDYTNS